mgnify:CR=1 FL=1
MWENIKKLYDCIDDMPPLYTDLLNANISIDIDKKGSITKIEKLDNPLVMNVPSTLAAENRSSNPAPYPVVDLIKNMDDLYFKNLDFIMSCGVNTDKLRAFYTCIKSENFMKRMETFAKDNKSVFKQLCPTITIDGEPLLDDELYNKWNNYYQENMLEKEGTWELSSLSGEYTYCTLFGKRKILSSVPTAKIFSTQYTKKRPVETGRKAPDVYIGITDSYKFHHALRYLVKNGYRWTNVTMIAWNDAGSIPSPLYPLSYYIYNATGEIIPNTKGTDAPYSTILNTDTNIFDTLDAICQMYIDKYANTLIHIAGLSAPSQGNINTVYYDLIPAAEYFTNLTKYYKDKLQEYSPGYYRFDGIAETLKFIGADRTRNLQFFTNMIKHATRREAISFGLQQQMMCSFDNMMQSEWYTLSYFNKYFSNQKKKDSFSYLIGRWMGVCTAIYLYATNVTSSIEQFDAIYFSKLKFSPFDYISQINAYVNMSEIILLSKAKYLVNIKNDLTPELLKFDLENKSANTIDYYLGYEDQLNEIKKINKERSIANKAKQSQGHEKHENENTN